MALQCPAVETALPIYIGNSLADSRKSLLFFPRLLKIYTTKKESAMKWFEFSWSIKIRLISTLSISIRDGGRVFEFGSLCSKRV